MNRHHNNKALWITLDQIKTCTCTLTKVKQSAMLCYMPSYVTSPWRKRGIELLLCWAGYFLGCGWARRGFGVEVLFAAGLHGFLRPVCVAEEFSCAGGKQLVYWILILVHLKQALASSAVKRVLCVCLEQATLRAKSSQQLSAACPAEIPGGRQERSPAAS